MSHVTNIILTTMCGEGVEHAGGPDTFPRTDAINAWLSESGHPPLLHADPFWHGHKVIEADIWIGGFNHLDLDGLLAVIKAQDWEDPEAVRVFVNKQEDTAFYEAYRGSAPA